MNPRCIFEGLLSGEAFQGKVGVAVKKVGVQVWQNLGNATGVAVATSKKADLELIDHLITSRLPSHTCAYSSHLG